MRHKKSKIENPFIYFEVCGGGHRKKGLKTSEICQEKEGFSWLHETIVYTP